MITAGSVIIGILFAIAIFNFLTYFKKYNMLKIVAGIITLFLVIYSCSLYVTNPALWIDVIIGIVVGMAMMFFYRFFFSKTKLHSLIINPSENNEMGEDDFMNTKKGKIITVVVILLVIYSLISTACIYKLNQKINSMVVITDELREEIAR